MPPVASGPVLTGQPPLADMNRPQLASRLPLADINRPLLASRPPLAGINRPQLANRPPLADFNRPQLGNRLPYPIIPNVSHPPPSIPNAQTQGPRPVGYDQPVQQQLPGTSAFSSRLPPLSSGPSGIPPQNIAPASFPQNTPVLNAGTSTSLFPPSSSVPAFIQNPTSVPGLPPSIPAASLPWQRPPVAAPHMLVCSQPLHVPPSNINQVNSPPVAPSGMLESTSHTVQLNTVDNTVPQLSDSVVNAAWDFNRSEYVEEYDGQETYCGRTEDYEEKYETLSTDSENEVQGYNPENPGFDRGEKRTSRQDHDDNKRHRSWYRGEQRDEYRSSSRDRYDLRHGERKSRSPYSGRDEGGRHDYRYSGRSGSRFNAADDSYRKESYQEASYESRESFDAPLNQTQVDELVKRYSDKNDDYYDNAAENFSEGNIQFRHERDRGRRRGRDERGRFDREREETEQRHDRSRSGSDTSDRNCRSEYDSARKPLRNAFDDKGADDYGYNREARGSQGTEFDRRQTHRTEFEYRDRNTDRDNSSSRQRETAYAQHSFNTGARDLREMRDEGLSYDKNVKENTRIDYRSGDSSTYRRYQARDYNRSNTRDSGNRHESQSRRDVVRCS